MHTLLAVGVVLTAAVFSSVQCERYVIHEPRLLSGGWGWGKKPIISINKGWVGGGGGGGWGKKPIVSVSKGWGWKFPTIKGIGIYGGIRLHQGQSEGQGGGWGQISKGGWGWGQKQQGWGWGHGGGGGGGGGGGHGGGWGHKQQGWGWGHGGGGGGGGGGGHGGWGWGGDDDGDDGGWGWERSSLPILVQEVVDSVEDSSVESGEVQERSDFVGPSEFDVPTYFEPVFYQ